jgi:hypothetical protein
MRFGLSAAIFIDSFRGIGGGYSLSDSAGSYHAFCVQAKGLILPATKNEILKSSTKRAL